MLFRRAGACVNDSDRLGQLTGLSPDVWAAHPAAFQDGDHFVVPWPVTEQIAAAMALAWMAPTDLAAVVEVLVAEPR